MLDSIHHAGAGVRKSDGAVKELSERVKHDFEKNVDNDLQVKEAFDELFRTLVRLTRLTKKKKVTSEDAQHIITTFKNIDSVLQVFPIL